MTKRDSESDDDSESQLSRRLALQLLSGVAVGGTVFGEGVGEAGASSENEEDDPELDEEALEELGVSDEQIRGPTEVVKGATETYEVNRSDSWQIVWTAENGTVDERGSRADVTFTSAGNAKVSVLVAEDGVPVAMGSLEVSVIEVSIGGPDEAAVGQRYMFVVPDEPEGVTLGDWSITPADAGRFITEGNRVAEVEFEAETSPATIELEYQTDSGHTDTAEHEVEVKQIELSIEDARLVQTVENTRVEDRDGTVLWDHEPDPDFVASRNASTGFNLEGKYVDLLEEDVTVVVERNRQWQDTSGMGTTSVFEDEFELQESRFGFRNDIERFVQAAHGIDELHTLATEYNVDVPVFPLDLSFAKLSSVELRIESDVVDSEPVTIERGTDFQVAERRTLRVGFIALKDPDDGENYGEGNDGYPFDKDDWDDEFLDAVDEAVEMTKEVYPVDEIEAYAHRKLMKGAVGIFDNALDDGVEAQDIIEEEFPEFDATILVVPEDYFRFHEGDDSTTRGLHFRTLPGDVVSKQPAAADVVRVDVMDELTPAHEMGHTFIEDLYEGPEDDDHPMARRTDGIIPGREAFDFHHARGTSDRIDGEYPGIGVRSTKFDLTDGTYEAQRENIASVMSYDTGDQFTRWADARLFQHLLDEGFEPTPPESSSWPVTSLRGTTDERIEVLSGIATIEGDGTATIRYMRQREGNPMPSDDEGNVTLTLQSVDGKELGTVTTVDEWVGLSEESIPISGTVPFVVPYPEEIEVIVFDREGTTSTIDPRGRLLASAKDRLAEESFIKNPDDRLSSLQDKLDSVNGQLQNSAYKAAYNKLTNDVRPRVEKWLHDDAAVPANYYTKSELLALLDDVIARLEALYDIHKDGDQGRGPPDGDDHPGRGPPDEDETEGGRGPPDDDEEFGRRPSDDDDHPGSGSDKGDDDDDDLLGGGLPDDDDDRGSHSSR